MSDFLKIGLLGAGNVGGAVLDVLARNRAAIEQKAQRTIEISKVLVRDPIKHKAKNANVQWVTDHRDITCDPAIDLVIEVLGGCDLAKEALFTAIKQRKAVVSANKALLSECGSEVFRAALEAEVPLAFESAVASSIPIIKIVDEAYSANRIETLVGILNGTSNFILTAMQHKKMQFQDALSLAQAKGFAEADPALDINGADASHKLALLSAVSFSQAPDLSAVRTVGLEQVTYDDLIYAKQLGYRIKSLAVAKRHGEVIRMAVRPTLVSVHHILSHVEWQMNAVLINSDCAGKSLHYGSGAGGEATASAVLADVIDIAQGRVKSDRYRALASSRSINHTIPESCEAENFYLRINAEDKAGMMAKITSKLAEFEISIEALLQKEHLPEVGAVPIVLLTHAVVESKLQQALHEMQNLAGVVGKINYFPVLPATW